MITLLDAIAQWIGELIKAGHSEEEAAQIVARDIKDLTAKIRANRSDINDAFKKKHGEEL